MLLYFLLASVWKIEAPTEKLGILLFARIRWKIFWSQELKSRFLLVQLTSADTALLAPRPPEPSLRTSINSG